MTSPRRQTTSAPLGRDHNRHTDIAVTPASSQATANEPQVYAERIGDILRRTRERRGDDLHHIAEYLCIRRSYLEAIEDSEYEKFPADAYVIGFLRSYAELLGLEGKEAINMYRAEMAGRRKKPVLSMPTPMPEGRSPSVFILIGAVVTAILVYASWYGISTSDRTTISTPAPLPSSTSSASPSSASEAANNTASSVASPVNVPVVPVVAPAPAVPAPSPPQATQPAPVVEEVPSSKPAVPEPVATATAVATPASVAAAKPPHLVIRADQSSWVMISDSKGQTIFDRVLKPGEVYRVPDGTGMSLTTGNGAGIVLTLDGLDLPKLSPVAASGSSGILRDIPLDGAHLRAVTRRD